MTSNSDDWIARNAARGHTCFYESTAEDLVSDVQFSMDATDHDASAESWLWQGACALAHGRCQHLCYKHGANPPVNPEIERARQMIREGAIKGPILMTEGLLQQIEGIFAGMGCDCHTEDGRTFTVWPNSDNPPPWQQR